MTKVNAVEVNMTSQVSRKPSNSEILITLVLDETGSMNSCWDSTISSVNDYMGSQKSAPGVAKASLYKFSSSGWGASLAEPVRTVFENKLVAEVEELSRANYVPNGGTNLYDAIGMTIRKIESQLAPLNEVPDVLMVIVTDGGENTSREYNLDAVKKLVQAKEAEGWTFIYLGANQDAWSVGQSFGLSKGQTMTYDTAAMNSTMGTLASATTAYRGLRTSGQVAYGSTTKNFFGDGKEKS